jgi:hypothetical protein
MDRIICTTLNAFRESWPDIDTFVCDILAGTLTMWRRVSIKVD